ncbi:polymer-forming cytoskeletal protein [Agrobacterium salinitolerans]|nr:polymer-forming cytoskeletal protein [Agrobacterium salinitolerans]
MTNRVYNDPERDVEISTAHRGNIQCRKLVVTATGSIVGNVEAYDVRNSGRINGIINAADVFINNEGARFRGSVYAPHLGVHPKSVFEASTSHSQRFNTEYPSPISPSAIDLAVQEGLRRELAKRNMASDDQGFNISPDNRFARNAAEKADDVQGPTSLPTEFRTPDGKLWPYQPQETFNELVFAPPGPCRGFYVEEAAAKPLPPSTPPRVPVPRALPPLFATEK